MDDHPPSLTTAHLGHSSGKMKHIYGGFNKDKYSHVSNRKAVQPMEIATHGHQRILMVHIDGSKKGNLTTQHVREWIVSLPYHWMTDNKVDMIVIDRDRPTAWGEIHQGC